MPYTITKLRDRDNGKREIPRDAVSGVAGSSGDQVDPVADALIILD